MGESLDVWREFFGTTDTEIFKFIDTAITIAALDRPRDFRLQRDHIAEQLFSTMTTQSWRPGRNDPSVSRDGGDNCVHAGKESKRIRDNRGGVVERNGVGMNLESHHDCGGSEALSGDIDEQSQVVGEVLKIKEVLDNTQYESDFALCESLRRLQLMTISVDILEKTKIGIAVDSLRRRGGSTQTAQLAHDIIMEWKAVVQKTCRSTKDTAAKNSSVDPRKLGEMDYTDRLKLVVKNQDTTKWNREEHSNKVSSIADGNQRPNMNKHQAANTSSSIKSGKFPPSKIATWKYEKERRLQNSNGIVGCKRLFTGGRDKINGSNEIAAEKKFGASKRISREHYQQEETAKRQRIVQALPALRKQPASHKTPSSRARIGNTLKRMAKSRSGISSF